MKQTTTMLLVVMFAYTAMCQTVFDSFDNSVYTDYVTHLVGLSDSSRVYPFQEKQIVAEGQGALRLEYKIELIATWGGAAILQLQHPEDTGLWDFSGYDSLSFFFYNEVPSSSPGLAHMRIHLYDASNVDDIAGTNLRGTEWWYSFFRVLDDDSGWNKIVIPLKDVGSAAADGDGGNGFWLTGWDGIEGNKTLDLDKIRGIGIEVFANNDGPPDHGGLLRGEFIFDNLVLNSKPTAVSESEQIPGKFALAQNYPNPFNPRTIISYSIPNNSYVTLRIYDIIGNEIKTLISEEKPIGNYEVVFDATGLSSGVYFYKIEAMPTNLTSGQDGSKTKGFIQTKKMILLR